MTEKGKISSATSSFVSSSWRVGHVVFRGRGDDRGVMK